MPADPNHSLKFDLAELDQLACPACLGALSAEEARLDCVSCGRSYPVVDGIPVLIAERAQSVEVSAFPAPENTAS